MLNKVKAGIVLGLIAIAVIVLFFTREYIGLSFDMLFLLELIAGVIIGVLTHKWVHDE